MTLRQPCEDALLSSEEITVIRQALSACSKLLTWAGEHGGPTFAEAAADAAEAAGLGRSPGALAYRASLAIDYLDFAPAAGRTR
jgi:hypothetical protein